jgi:hypothetical protein
MMFVLDASGSMTARLPGGRTRMDAAKTAMNTLIDGLPVNIHVGLAAYGMSTGSSEGEKAAGCRDVRTLQPVGRVDRSAMRAKVATEAVRRGALVRRGGGGARGAHGRVPGGTSASRTSSRSNRREWIPVSACGSSTR